MQMENSEKNLSDKLNDDMPTWKYFDLVKFLYLLSYKKLYFRNILKLIDESEGSLPDEWTLYRAYVPHGGNSNKYKKLKEKNERKNQEIDQICNEAKNNIAVNCWTLNDTESFALWKIYSDNYGIAIKSTIGKIRKALSFSENNVKICRVNYEPDTSEFSLETIVKRKKSFYSFENELRLYTDTPKGDTEIAVDTNELIKDIYLTPFMPEYAKSVIKELIINIDKSFVDRINVSSIKFRE
jgi:hypothetical protein